MPAPLIAAAMATLAPTLAAKGLDLLGGLFKGTTEKGAQKVAELIEAKTGIEIQDIAENRLDEAQWEQLRGFEVQNKQAILAAYVELDKNDVERERIAQGDRADARDTQQAATISSDKFTARFHNILTLVLVFLSFVFLFWAGFLHDYKANPESKDLINTILGFLFPVVSAVVAYHYGTTLGSRRKDDRAEKLSEAIVEQSKQ
jgi:uncharacterized membrane protein (DUF485 family)